MIMGLACGTFLYVAVCDLLPEVFHGGDRPLVKLASVVVGIGLTALTLPRLESLFGFVLSVLRESLAVFVEFSPFLLLGFLIAGVLSQIVRVERLTRHMGGNDLKSVTLASLVGAPLPLCSCSVVPVAASMRRAGASKGATSAFLIATPETGVDSVTVTWALLDPLMTIARPVGAVVSAIFTGSVVNLFVRRGWDERVPAAAAAPACCQASDLALPARPGQVSAPIATSGAAVAHGHADHAGHAHDATPQDAVPRPPAAAAGTRDHAHGAPGRPAPVQRLDVQPAATRAPWLVRVLRYAFVEMLDDLSVSLLVGTLLSGLIAVLVPPQVFESPIAQGFGGMLLMLLIGIPIYVCAAASTPIAATLILKGLDPGAAFVFLLASPATNLGSLFVLSRELGARIVLVHVLALAAVTLALGLLVDALYRWLDLAPRATAGVVQDHTPWLGSACAIVLGALILGSLVRTRGAAELVARLRAVASPAAN